MEAAQISTPTLRDLGFIDDESAASLMGVKPLTLANWRAADKGPPFTKVHGNKIVYPLDELKKWLAARTVRPERPDTLVRTRTARPHMRGAPAPSRSRRSPISS